MTVRTVSNLPAAMHVDTARCLFAIELSKQSWVIGFITPLSAKISRRILSGGDWKGLLDLIEEVQGRASHPSLWTVRQWQPRGQHRAGARAARCAAPGAAARDRLHRRIRATARAAETMPVLRRPHDHHRDLRAWLPAKASPHTCSADHPDRHLMRPSPPIDNRSAPCLSRRLTAGSARARVGPPQSSALSRRILSCSVRPTRLLLHAPSLSRQKRSRRTLRSNLLKPRPAAKSP